MASNAKTGVVLAIVASGMLGLAFAAVPLYKAFCAVTGFGGTPLRADAAPGIVLDETITVRFDASTDPDLPWKFRPAQREITLPIGESGLAFYTATNPTDEPVAGQAVFNVTPMKIGQYFVKIDCFCFTEQVLQPGQTVQMPVSFYIDPEIRADRLTEEVESVTLSYTFYRIEPSEAQLAVAETENRALN